MKQDTSTSSPNQQLLKAELDAIAERIPSVPARNLWPWLQQVLRGNKDTIISLILAILPNLKELRIHVNHYNQLETTMALIGSIVTAGDQFQNLPKLCKFTIVINWIGTFGM